jgi:death on curing protein
MDPLFLSLDEVLEIHAQQIELYGGSDGVRDPPGLESALATPMATFGGQFLHPGIPSMAAAYLFHLCQNHAFVDGNKRTGANAAITFLLINDWELDVSEDELIDLVLSVASGETLKSALTETFEAPLPPHSRSAPRLACRTARSAIGPTGCRYPAPSCARKSARTYNVSQVSNHVDYDGSRSRG